MTTDNFTDHKQRGNDLYRSGKYHESIREYTKCIEIDNNIYLPYANRAMCYLKIGKYEKAENDCSKCLQLAPKYVKGYLRRGAARKALGKLDLSLSDYQKVLKLQPKNSQARKEMNELNQIMNDNENENENKSKDKKNKIFYGQIIVGPPGSGKTTYCHAISQYMTNVLHRNVAIINLDPNNENMEYHPLINIYDLISSDDVAKHLNLGPNGSLIYCLEYLSENMEWLEMKLNNLIGSNNTYLIFDCPGQIELYIHHKFMKKITSIMVNQWHYRLTCVNLVDCFHCCSSNLLINDNSNFISIALMTTSIMLHLELPHINILTKCDLIKYYDKNITMPIEFYMEGHDLQKLSQSMYNNYNKNDNHQLTEMEKKFKKLNNEFAACINDYGLLSFIKFSITDIQSIAKAIQIADKSNGYDLLGQYLNEMEIQQTRVNDNYNNDNDNDNDNDLNVFDVTNPLLKNTPFAK